MREPEAWLKSNRFGSVSGRRRKSLAKLRLLAACALRFGGEGRPSYLSVVRNGILPMSTFDGDYSNVDELGGCSARVGAL